ncbi:MAG: hypothetical protein Q9175_001604 [Cornicularia normoerica]
MIACCLRSRGMVDASSVMISAIRSERPSSDPPNVGIGEFSAAEAQDASQETEDRERDMENRRTVGEGTEVKVAESCAVNVPRTAPPGLSAVVDVGDNLKGDNMDGGEQSAASGRSVTFSGLKT